ncbi:transposase [Ralstonia sp. A12]|uniref:transposase n=1 Tax=Ralstonia sp. A12 TaxID=1217052 RepID=UPI0018DE0372|nr:transposase [Ralstonia sp. A12]
MAQREALLQHKDREIELREANIEKLTFELARLKRWKFGTKSEAMNAEQRRLFEETLAEEEAAYASSSSGCIEKMRPLLLPRTPRPRYLRGVRAATRCPNTCGGWNTAMSPRTPTARSLAAVAR